MNTTINFLLNNAGPSIRYRIKSEVLNSISAKEKLLLQEEISKEKDIEYILKNRQSDGWLGTCFHSRMRGAKQFDVCETAIRYLAEKGVDLTHPAFEGAMHVILHLGHY